MSQKKIDLNEYIKMMDHVFESCGRFGKNIPFVPTNQLNEAQTECERFAASMRILEPSIADDYSTAIYQAACSYAEQSQFTTMQWVECLTKEIAMRVTYNGETPTIAATEALQNTDERFLCSVLFDECTSWEQKAQTFRFCD